MRFVDEVLLVVVTVRVELPGLVVDEVVVRVGVVLVGLEEEPVFLVGVVAVVLV